MGNTSGRADHHEEDRIIREVSKLFASSEYPTTSTTTSASTSVQSHGSSKLTGRQILRATNLAGDDVLSKSTESTNGSPDLSVHRRETMDHLKRTSSTSRRGILYSSQGEAISTHASKSPFSRLLFRRKTEEDKPSNLPSSVIVEQQRVPPRQ